MSCSLHVHSQLKTLSNGKQLIELKKAVDEGAMIQDDYLKEKSQDIGILRLNY